MEHYLDNSATTRVCAEAIAAMTELMAEDYGNPSSTHRKGRDARQKLDAARADVAAALGARPEELFFTSGGTEADNWALIRGAEAGRHKGRHIITTAIEHDAVLNSAKYLEKQGCEVTYLAPNSEGGIDLEALEAALRPDTVLVSMMLVNNETGAVLPVKQAAELTRRLAPHALFHTDAVQGFMKLPFTPAALGADLVSLSAHKIHGPKGVGALWIRSGVKLPPLLFGGGQESGQRSGTEALPAIVGFGAAAKRAKDNFAADTRHMLELKNYAVSELKKALPETYIVPGEAPHILNFSAPGPRSEVLINALEASEVYISQGSACKRGRRSHVLTAMKLAPKIIDGAVRVSLSPMNTKEDIDALVAAAAAACATLVNR